MTPIYPEQLGEGDAVFLLMDDDPVLSAHYIGGLVLESLPEPDAYAAATQRMLALVPRRRQGVRPVPWSTALPFWVDVEPPSTEMRPQPVPGDGSLRALLDHMADLVTRPIALDRPLMNEHVFEFEDGRAVVVVVGHHLVGDGGGFSAHILDIFSGEPPPPIPAPRPVPPGWRLWLRGTTAEARKAVAFLGRMGERVAHARRDPAWLQARRRAKRAAFLSLMRSPNRPLSPLMTGRSGGYRFDRLEVPIDAFKAGAKAAGGTVNDAFLAALGEAFGHYHQAKGAPVSHLMTGMAVNARTDADADEQGNILRNLVVRIPCDTARPLTERIAEVHALVLSERFDDERARLTQQLIPLGNRMPRRLVSRQARRARGGIDLSTSNMALPGPLHMYGRELVGVLPFGLRAGSAVSSVFSSINGVAYVGLNSDPAAVTDPDLLARCMADALAAVVAIAAPGGSADARPTTTAG